MDVLLVGLAVYFVVRLVLLVLGENRPFVWVTLLFVLALSIGGSVLIEHGDQYVVKGLAAATVSQLVFSVVKLAFWLSEALRWSIVKETTRRRSL